MGILDRFEKIIGGFGSATANAGGFFKDLALIPFKDEEDFNGLLHTVVARGQVRGSNVIEGLFGPDSGVGAAVGGVPGPIRDALRGPLHETGKALNYAYEKAIDDPLTTAMTAGSLASSPQFLDAQGRSESTALFDPDTWTTAHKIAKDRSFGESVGLAVGTRDILDPREVEAAKNSDLYKLISGVTNVVTAYRLDPTALAAGKARDLYVAKVNKPITDATSLHAVSGSPQVHTFIKALDGKSAAEIRHQFFPNLANGAPLAHALASASDDAERASVLRLAMGDRGELGGLWARRADLAGQIERLTGEQSILAAAAPDHFAKVNARTGTPSLFAEDPSSLRAASELERTEAELDALYSAESRLRYNEEIVGSLRGAPRIRATDEARSEKTRSATYQKSTFAAPLRTVFNMRPHRLVNLNDPAGDVTIHRFLQKSGLEQADQDVLRGKYIGAATPEERGAALVEIEDAAIAKVTADLGLSQGEIAQIQRQISGGRATAAEVLRGKVYDGEGRSKIRFKDDDGVMHEYPLLVTTTANVLPLADIDAMQKAAGRIGQFKARHPGAAVPEDLLDKFMRVWKPSVLLRVGWPIRVIGDEQMRIMAKIGVLAQMKNLTAGIGNKAANAQEKLDITRRLAAGEITVAEAKALRAQPGSHAIGFGHVNVGGYDLEAAFGASRAEPNAFFDLSSSRASFEKVFGDAERKELDRLRSATGQYRSIHPVDDAADYSRSWLQAVNQQIGRDPLARIFLNGGDLDEAVAWLRSPEGRAHAAKLPLRRRNLRDWAGAVQDQVESYTLGNAAIKAAALKSKASIDDLARLQPDASLRPIVHGEVLADALGSGPAARALGGIVEAGYRNLGSVPSDLLSRHPFFDSMYRAEAGRLVGLLDEQAKKSGQKLTSDELRLVERKSREYALSETKKLLYDLAEESDLAHMSRFLMPFYSAWQETITRWAGLAVENPRFVLRMRDVWQAPERFGLVTDENGVEVAVGDDSGDTRTIWTNTVDENGQPVRQRVTVGKQRYITLPVPGFAKDMLGVKGLRQQGEVQFNKNSFNLMLQGAPGFGPVVQVPVNEIVKDRPDLAASVSFVLPYGVQQNVLQSLLPATARRLTTQARGEEDRSFRNAALRIYFDSVVDFRTGKRQTPPTFQEALGNAKAFYSIRAVASFVSPAAPRFRSPYQPYIDAYRRMRQADPKNADRQFIDTYGEEFFPLTQAFSRSIDGVVPTVEAFKARGKYRDLVEKHPDLGGLIIGAEGAGEFNNAVYQAQFAQRVGPGSLQHQRDQIPFEEAAAGPDTRMGWLEYRKIADLITSARVKRGLPNLQVKGAQDLALLKRAMVAKLAEKYPAWYDDYAIVDRNAMAKRLAGMREIAADPKISQRQDIAGLKDYLALREKVRGILERRVDKKTGAGGDLNSKSNRDVALIWSAITERLVENNLAFSDLYHRYLERDDLSAA